MKKKVVIALLALLSAVCLAFGLSACGGGNGNSSSNFTFELSGDSYAITGYYGNDTEIVIPETYGGLPVTAIVGGAFQGCESLTKITVPDSVTSIGEDAFNDTAYYINPDNWINDVLYIGNHLIEAKDTLSDNYEIRQGTKTIADYAFYSCANVTGITISDSVIYIGDWAFQHCSNLESVTFEADSELTYIGGNAFADCGNLKDITIPFKVTYIGNLAFTLCTSLESVTFENTAGWKVSSDGDESGAEVTVTNDSAQNATLLTADYCSYIWQRYDN